MIVVIGGGVSGLCVATKLVQRGFTVTLLESSSRWGGRLHSFVDRESGAELDNGQHVLLTSCRSTLSWLMELGVDLNYAFSKYEAIAFHKEHRRAKLATGRGPYPLNVITGIARFSLLTPLERWRTLSTMVKLKVFPTIPLDAALRQCNESAAAVQSLWEPLCRAVMNAELREVETKVFMDIFTQMMNGSTMLIPRGSLREIFVQPAVDFLEHSGVFLQTHGVVEELVSRENTVTAVRLKSGEDIPCDAVVSCVPPVGLNRWLNPRAGIEFQSSGIINVHLWHPPFMHEDVVACCGTFPQWVFRKSETWVQVTISSANGHLALTDEEIVDRIGRDMEMLFPRFQRRDVDRTRVIRERRATYRTGNPIAPGRFRWSNFFLAGDWTNTGLPCTIESACRSAEMVSKALTKMELPCSESEHVSIG